MFDRTIKTTAIVMLALSASASPAWADLGRAMVPNLLFLPGDHLLLWTVSGANAVNMPWVVTALDDAMVYTYGWFSAGLSALCWSLLALVLVRLFSALKNRLSVPRRSVKAYRYHETSARSAVAGSH